MKKNFASATVAPNAMVKTVAGQRLGRPDNTVVRFPANSSTTRTADFAPFYGQGYDEITEACQRTLEALVAENVRTGGKVLSATTLAGQWRNGAKLFFSYLRLLRAATGSDLTMADLTSSVIKHYAQHLKSRANKYGTQKGYYTNTKSLLIACHRLGYWPQVDIKSVFPDNPFPRSKREVAGQQPLTKSEKRLVVQALRTEMTRISEGSGLLSSYDLTICVLSIALSTGMNASPILGLLTDCIQPHPFKANLRLLVSFKRRANSTQVVALRKSLQVASMASIKLQAAGAIEQVIERNAALRPEYLDHRQLFVYRSSGGNAGSVVGLSAPTVHNHTLTFAKRHKLVTDSGKPLTLNLSRLRKTFLNRIWELSGQDPLMTAKTGRHALKTGDAHYWVAPPEAEANMRFIGEARVKDLRARKKVIASDRTPIASCNDPKQGQRAPKNGNLCTEILGCFRCKSFVVTEDDLFRLFSFYWAVVRHHESFGGKRWRKYLRQVIRLIDEEITTHFNAELVSDQKEKARHDPHPFWRDLTMARMAR